MATQTDVFNAYAVLKLGREADPELIEAAHQLLIMKNLPDTILDSPRKADAEQYAKNLNRAKTILLNPAARAKLDAALAAEPQKPSAPLGSFDSAWGNEEWEDDGDATGVTITPIRGNWRNPYPEAESQLTPRQQKRENLRELRAAHFLTQESSGALALNMCMVMLIFYSLGHALPGEELSTALIVIFGFIWLAQSASAKPRTIRYLPQYPFLLISVLLLVFQDIRTKRGLRPTVNKVVKLFAIFILYVGILTGLYGLEQIGAEFITTGAELTILFVMLSFPLAKFMNALLVRRDARKAWEADGLDAQIPNLSLRQDSAQKAALRQGASAWISAR